MRSVFWYTPHTLNLSQSKLKTATIFKSLLCIRNLLKIKNL